MSAWMEMERAQAGEVAAMYQLGGCYYEGTGGVARDYDEARAWYGRAAALGDKYALYMLGAMQEHGLGTRTTPNLFMALYYYRRAEDKGFDCTEAIERVEAAIDADPALRAAAAAVDALHEELERDNPDKDAELREQEQALKRERDAFDAAKREHEEQQRAREAALAEAARVAAVAKQAEILEARHADGSKHRPTRDAIAAAWTPTAVRLVDCPVHARPIAPGQSVLLGTCLHSICRECAPHILQPDGTVRCPVCQAVSHLDAAAAAAALPHHPFIEAELAAGEAHPCTMCQAAPEDDRLPATAKCTSCVPAKLLCEAHAVHHRLNAKTATHVALPLPHGGAALRCPTHDKPVEAFCTGCRQLICLACTLSTHPSHPARLLTDAPFVEAVRARLLEGVAVARTVAEALIDHAADASLAGRELDERDATTESEIDRTIQVLVGVLERRREAAHEQRLARSRAERAALQRFREESEYRWRILTSAADLAEQLATGTHLGVNATAVMLQLEGAATARLDAVLELAPERAVPAPSILRFAIDESLAEQLGGLGEVVQDA